MIHFPVTFQVILLNILMLTDAQNTTLPYIHYFTYGYDVISGNPQNDNFDTGFRDSVFSLNYSENSLSSDGKFLVPNNVEAIQVVGCSYQSEANEILGSMSYQNSLVIDASVAVGSWISKFSASPGYQEIRKGTETYHCSYVSSIARCSLYVAKLRHVSTIRLSNNFADAVKNLPTEDTGDRTSKYLQFISEFGTHYISRLIMGAKVVTTSGFEQKTWSTLEKNSFSFTAAAKASFMGLYGQISSLSETAKQLKDTFDSNRTYYRQTNMGILPSADGRWETWAESAGKYPYPISYDLCPLTELFNSIYFPNVDAKLLQKKREMLNKIYDVYCESIPNCENPLPDRVPVRMYLAESTIIQQETVACNPGFSLLSCSVSNMEKKYRELFRYALPLSATSCACFDRYGAKCHSWCSNAVAGFKMVSSTLQSNTFGVMCPNGSKVMGCTVVPYLNQSIADRWRAHYPTDDGNGCTCKDLYGAQCYATCASNIVNHEVRSEYGSGRGKVTVHCSPNNFVLGCGMRPAEGKGPEKWREFRVLQEGNACECYDFYGATCYALCGQFARE